MVFNHQSRATSLLRPKRRSAFTLAETLIAIGIGSMVAVTLATTLIFGVRSMAALNNYVSLDRGGRAALDRLMGDIRGAHSVDATTPSGSYTDLSQITFTDQNYATLVYEFNSTSNLFTRTVNGGTPEILLTGCTGHFELFQQALQPGSWNQYDTPAGLDSCKIVLVKWTCTRRMYGSINNTNTEDQVTAKVLMRN